MRTMMLTVHPVTRDLGVRAVPLFLGLLAACSSSASTATEDSGSARAPDARAADAGGRGDVGSSNDAGRDAGGHVDATHPEDAAGNADAGHSEDAGGSADAVPPEEGGQSIDAAHDAANLDSAPLDGGGATCAGELCYAGETCVDGGCELGGCNGVTVPGDYATIQSAVTALAGAGGGTICLAAQAYAESVSVTAGSFTLQGVDRKRSTLNNLGVQASSVTIIGMAIGTCVIDDFSLSDVAFTAKNAAILSGLALSTGGSPNFSSIGSISLTLDAVDVGANPLGGQGGAISIDFGVYYLGPPLPSVTLSVTNSYFHGSSSDNPGLFIGGPPYEDGYNAWNLTVTLENDTFDGVGVLDSFSPGTNPASTSTLTVTNTLFVNAPLALSSQATTTDSYDGFYGNTTNFAGVVIPGAKLVTGNPSLDTSTPPGLLAGSPDRGAGNPAGAPAHDFYGRPRSASVDIGAVQSSP